MNRSIAPVLGALLLVTFGCSGDDTGPNGPGVIRMSVVSGNNQTGTVGTQLATALVIQALNGSNQPIPNLVVNFEPATGGGSAYAGAVVTDASGNARDYWILGPTAGTQTLEVRTVNATTGTKTVYGSFTATANAAAASKLIQVAGNLQDGYGAFAVATPPTVEVTDAFGNPKAGIGVTFAVASGGGSVTGGSTSTASDGTAKPSAWTLGGAPGINSLTATSGTLSGSPSTFLANALFSVKAIAVGYYHSCELRADGATFCTGSNANGQLGTGNTTDWLRMTPAAGGRMFNAIASGQAFGCGLASGGALFCWGNNSYGQLGTGTTTNSNVPVQVTGGLTFKALAGGDYDVCGITTAGAGYCWGYNGYGGLGNNTTTNQSAPASINGSLTWAQLGAGQYTTCGVTTAGAGFCWGFNVYGQIGNGTTTNASTPQAVSGAHVWRQISSGFYHSCGVTTSNAIYCWGYNSNGQLGNGTTTNSTTPVLVSGGLAWQEVRPNTYTTCGITTAGKAYCWGNNGSGSVGDGTTTERHAPVAIATGTPMASLGSTDGYYAQCAVAKSGGAPWCWGYNGAGELGTGSTSTGVVTPFKVLNP